MFLFIFPTCRDMEQKEHKILDLLKTGKYDTFSDKVRNGTYVRNIKQHTKNTKFLKRRRAYLDTRRTTRKAKSNQKKIIDLDYLIGILGRIDHSPVIPYTIKPTLAQGDCFYSALYRVSLERDLLDEFAECLHVDTKNEDTFITTMRKKVADEIAGNRLVRNGGEDAYDTLTEMLGELNKQDYNESIEQFTREFKLAFPYPTKLGTRTNFLKRLSDIARVRRNYVSQFEVDIVSGLLQHNCKVRLVIYNNEHPRIKIKEGANDVINLYNQGEGHYVYFST